MDSKEEIRRSIKKKLASLNSREFRNQGIDARTLTIRRDVWKQSRSVLLFMSMNHEIDTEPLLSAAFSEDKQVFLPRVCGDIMHFYRIDSLRSPWDTGSFGIREPQIDGARQFQAGSAAFPVLIILPGLAFDRMGNRLGRGKGYYDGFLREMRTLAGTGQSRFFTLGLCLKEQLLDQVPREHYDQRVDAICTGNEYIEVIKGKL